MRDWTLLVAETLAGWLSSRNFSRIPSLAATPTGDAGHVSIIIPARDEAERLPELLRSLARLRYPDVEVVVVDDDSHDDTAEMAAEAGARVIHIDGPEPGWTGKNFACWSGARATTGEWLLFTDADTVHDPDSLGRALTTARLTGAGLVSLLPRQRCVTFWERLLLPYAYALYFVGRWTDDPIANGQYILIGRQDYERIGGHAAVAGNIVEDVALGRLAHRLGVRVVLARGEDAVQVRMYGDLAGLWEGFGKNAYRFVTASPRTGIPTVAATIAYGPALPAVLRRRSRALRLAVLVAPVAGLLPWERRFGVPAPFALLYPLAALVFQLLALDSIRRSLVDGGTIWKGRRY